MRICIIGKFPPIQGGVSMRTYWTAHALAARGHDVHVVTNAKEAAPPFRMHMRPEDWSRCEPQGLAGSVKVHWTEPADCSQSYIPMASPFVSKLASLAGRVHSQHPLDVIISHYMEPYGIAGFVASHMTGAPHVVRMAGSDAGRLWRHPQLETLYDHVLQAAQFVVASGSVRGRAIEHGVDPARIVSGGGYSFPEDLFTPEGASIDVAALCDEVEKDADLRDMLWGSNAGGKPHFGIYGKLGDTKGSFALLAALHRLKREGLEFGLVALAHGRADIESRFRERVGELGLSDNVLQIPFVPHWRVPEFLRGCLAVCCLEQDFPIRFHSPMIALEVLLCGSCLVASTEVIRKLPQWERLPHGYGCVAINNVGDVPELSGKLSAILRRPQLAAVVGARGRAFALDAQKDVEFPARLELILTAAAERRALPSEACVGSDEANARPFPLTRMAGLALSEESSSAAAVDPLFRIGIGEWAMEDDAIEALIPTRNGRSRVLRCDHGIPEFFIRAAADMPTSVGPGPSHIVVFNDGNTSGDAILIDPLTARILALCDGKRTCGEIACQLSREFGKATLPDPFAWMENLLVSGLIGLHQLKQDDEFG